MVPKPAIRSIFTDHFDHSLRNKSKAKKVQVFDKEDTNPARTISWLWARQLSLSILSTYLDKYLDLAKILQYQHFHKFVQNGEKVGARVNNKWQIIEIQPMHCSLVRQFVWFFLKSSFKLCTLRERPLMMSDFRGGRGLKWLQKIGH